MFLELNQIKKSFGSGENRVQVLKGIDLAVEKGEFCVLLGPSGSGKSTLLNILGGIDRADSGDILIDGERMADMNEKALTLYRRRHLGYIFQMYNLIPNLTVRENIEVGAYLSRRPLDVDELLHLLLSCGITAENCPTSFPAASSNAPPLAVPSLRIRTSCFAMSPPARWITRPARRY